MNKRILAFICMLALLVGLLPVGAVAQTESPSNTYLVGYAKKDINPWADPDDPTQGVLPVLLSGTGTGRACTGIMNDRPDENDGLFTTCTAISDDNGTTVLFITLDTLQADPTAISDIRNDILMKLVDESGKPVVNGNQIIISGSHTHSAPDLLSLKNSNDSTFTTYYAYIKNQILEAAQEAYDDRAAATMKRGSIDAKDATGALDYNGGDGYQMNFLRHYSITAENSTTGDVITYEAGTNFSSGSIDKGDYGAATGYKVTAADHVAEADNTMHLLQFEFADSDKDPIVLVNWRAHPTMNDSGANANYASSDYVNALRYYLENDVDDDGNEDDTYRVAFFQGAGANTIASSRYHTDWKQECGNTANAITYGKLLAEIARYCMEVDPEDNMTDSLPYGDIRIVRRTFEGAIQQDSEGLLAAANAATSYPYTHTYTDDKEYTVNSNFHKEQIIKRSNNANNQAFVTQEIAVVSLGNAAAFVTAPNELSDRYDVNDSFVEKDNGKSWQSLVNEDTYGTPFVITHANGNMGYLPNAKNYTYNADSEIQGKIKHGIGSYEANISRYAEGTGEDLIAEYAKILKNNETGIINKMCDDCGEKFDWIPVSYLQHTDNYLGSGHYYLTEDISSNIQKTVRSDERLCLDLNGQNITITGRTFGVDVGGTLNIFDSKETGSVTSIGANNNLSSGTFSVSGIMNIYGGTFACEQKGRVSRGGVVGVNSGGRLNMYGGTINATDLVINSADVDKYNIGDPGVGGAIYVAGGEAHFYNDAKVTIGTAPEGGFGPCVALGTSANSKVFLYDNASVDDIYFRPKNSSNLTVSGTFAGNVGLSYASDITLEKDTVIGSALNNANISGATFRLPATLPNWRVYTENNYLKIKEGYDEKTVALVGGTEYDSLQDAVDKCNGSIIQLIKNVDTATTVDKNVYLDLNGCDVTGAVTVDAGYTLYCKDSQTDDYTIDDDAGYGKLTNVSGTVKGIPVDPDSDQDGYLMINEGTDEAPKYSFHRVDLGLDYITLSPGAAPGVSYKGNFKGDEKVEAAVEKEDCGYGVALSVLEMPDENNLDTKCRYSEFTQFDSGSKGNTGSSTKLINIMKSTNATLINYRNANMKIYGRAYIKTAENEYMFGEGREHTLKTVTQEMNEKWDTLKLNDTQKNALIKMYSTHASVMKHWDLTNLIEAMDPTKDDTLSILMVGNSFCYYYVEELYGLLMANPDPNRGYDNVEIYNLYYSGCRLDQHLSWWQAGAANYQLFKTDVNGRVDLTPVSGVKWTLEDALQQGRWDYISLQGQSTGVNYTAADLSPARSSIAEKAAPLLNRFHELHPGAQLLWHRTWAFEVGRISGSTTYDAERLEKYDAGMQAVCDYMCNEFDTNKDYDLIQVNSGAAWTVARANNASLATPLIPEGGLCARLNTRNEDTFPYYGGNNHAGDGYHDGDIGGGQFLNACVWYETLTGQSCLENTYKPTKVGGNYELSDEFAGLLRNAAHTALKP